MTTRRPIGGIPINREFFEGLDRRRQTLRGLADRAGYSRNRLFEWRRGYRSPNLASFVDLVEAAGGRLVIEWGDVPPETLSQVKHGFGGAKFRAEDMPKMVAMRDRKMSLRTIATYYGVDPGTIKNHLDKWREKRGIYKKTT